MYAILFGKKSVLFFTSIIYESATQNCSDLTSISHNNLTDNFVSFQKELHVNDSAVQPFMFLICIISFF